MTGTICEENPLVPRFEGEEDKRCETMDFPVAEYPMTSVEFPPIKNFNCALKSMFGPVVEGCRVF